MYGSSKVSFFQRLEVKRDSLSSNHTTPEPPGCSIPGILLAAARAGYDADRLRWQR